MNSPGTDQLLSNRYRLIHQVGKGGMALVFKTYDTMLERMVAVKILKEDFSSDPRFQERFRQEAKSAANLSHPNIVTVYDFGIDLARLFIVMEYVSGEDLKSIIQKRSFVPEPEGLKLMIQACQGLGYAHRANIVHCDVKPHNILVSEDGRLKITDFGIARVLSSIPGDQKNDYVWGSPQYFSPEQATGSPPTPASDVYSLGVVMYELFTGKLPFEAETIDELTIQHQSVDPLDPCLVNPSLSRELGAILLKVLSKEPSARYRTADQLGHVLSSLLEKKWLSDSPPPIPTQNRNETNYHLNITPEDYPTNPIQDYDWKLIGLELLALLFVGGLIPFWLFVMFKISTAIR